MRYLLTGGAGGLGFAAAQEIASIDPEAKILLTDMAKEALEEKAHALSGRCVVVTHVDDLSSVEAPGRAVNAARSAFGGLEGVFSNAGITHGFKITDLEPEEFARVININLRATALLAKAAYPMLKESRGALVATGSTAGTNPTPGLGVYGISKAALIALVRQLALEWAADGIRCNCVSPGTTLTHMSEGFYKVPEIRASRERAIPLGRWGRPEEIGATVAFLLSPKASFVNGVNLLVDGGHDIALFHQIGTAISAGETR